MTPSCADLDPFFDGELPREAAADFREHLAGCKRCQEALRGRMQEEAIVGGMSDRGAQHRRTIVYVAPILAIAAGVAIWLVGARRARPAAPIEVALAIEHHGGPMRGGEHHSDPTQASVAHVGDVLRPTVRGDGHRAIWVYLGARELVIACPDAVGCLSADDGLALEFRVSAPGQYSIIAISSAQPIRTPHGPLDLLLSSIAVTGAHFEIKRVDVN